MSSPKKTATRDQILMATFECLAEKGTTAITLRDIATKAGITLSLIHYYFPTKEGLLVNATSYVMQKQIKEIQKELSNIQDFSEKLKNLIFVVHHQFKNSEWRKVYFTLLAAKKLVTENYGRNSSSTEPIDRHNSRICSNFQCRNH